MAGDPTPRTLYTPFSFEDVLDQFQVPIKNSGLTIAQNITYRRIGGYGKRTGTAPYGGAASALPGPVKSGVRWHRGVPSAFKAMIVQSGDTLYQGNDGTGAFTSIGSLTASSSPAFFASAFDPAQSNVTGNPASDILIIASGQGPPKKFDGLHLTQLNSTITNPFTGCAFYHEHVAFWGDPSNPDTVYFTDLGNPESYVFSQSFGGYQIGRGDGDPFVQVCVPNGPYLYVFKNESIYAFSGYDFAQGDYQFQLAPAVVGIGTSAPFSVQTLDQSLIWWSGEDFWMLQTGGTQATRIGTTIVTTIAQAAKGSQSAIRAFAGDVLVQNRAGYFMYTNLYICAVDITGSGIASTLLVYDADASQARGKPAWSIWTNLNVGAFIPWGGPGDQNLLYFGDAVLGQVTQIGGDPTADVTGAGARKAIPVVIATGRNGAGAPDRKKRLDRLYLDVESGAAQFDVVATSDSQQSSTASVFAAGSSGGLWGANWLALIWGSTSGTTYQSLYAAYAKTVVGYNFTVTINESSASSSYEVVAIAYRSIMEGYRP